MMSNEKILNGNMFANCSIEELSILWNGMKDFYDKGWFEYDNPVTPYKDKYCAMSPIGVVQVEQDLLRAIAVKFIT